ncbi:NAD(P)/FAD-dependent oxidoreductase [Roseivivax sp. CAU 1761]
MDADIVIAGAGIVGTCTALWARMRGHDVLLVDPAPPGSGTSSGNACTLATYACLPVNDPAVLAALPRLLFARDSALSVAWPHALTHPRWMLSFLANCRSARSRAIAGHLARLLSRADDGLDPLIREAGAGDLVVAGGQLTVWSSRRGAEAARGGLDLRRRLGVAVEHLSAAEAQALEPGLDLPVAAAAFFPEARHIRDPEALVRRLHARFADLGGRTLAERVLSLHPEPRGVTVRCETRSLAAGRAVIAAGAFSGRIAGSGAERLPLGTERGYHLRFAGSGARLNRPVGWAEGGFYAVPMAQGLRLAGTVEIAALGAPPNRERLAYLARRGGEMFRDLPAPDASWLGFRPTMPDSLPVIGPSPVSDRILHAFGHQHLGLTLAGITGRLVTEMVEGRPADPALAAFRPDRSYAPLR